MTTRIIKVFTITALANVAVICTVVVGRGVSLKNASVKEQQEIIKNVYTADSETAFSGIGIQNVSAESADSGDDVDSALSSLFKEVLKSGSISDITAPWISDSTDDDDVPIEKIVIYSFPNASGLSSNKSDNTAADETIAETIKNAEASGNGSLLFGSSLRVWAAQSDDDSTETAESESGIGSADAQKRYKSVGTSEISEDTGSSGSSSQALVYGSDDESDTSSEAASDKKSEETDSEKDKTASDKKSKKTESNTDETASDKNSEEAESETETAVSERTDVVHTSVDVPIDFEALWDINDEAYAWIKIGGTDIDYPILRSRTDNQYYLTHTIEKEEVYPGAIFTQDYNSMDFDDPCTVVYGHAMKFYSLYSYKDEDFWTTHRYVTIYKPQRILTYRVYAAVSFNRNHLLFTYDFSDADSRKQFLKDLDDNKSNVDLFDLGVEIDDDDKILILSTCTARGDDSGRYIVVCKLIDDLQGNAD